VNAASIRENLTNWASQFPNNWTATKQSSIIDLVYKNFQEEQLNSRFPEGISSSSRFSVFAEVVDTLQSFHTILTFISFFGVSKKYKKYSNNK